MSDPTRIDLPSGAHLSATVEDLRELATRLPHLLACAEAEQAQDRAATLDRIEHRLVPADRVEYPMTWSLPPSLGRLTHGVPVLQFHTASVLAGGPTAWQIHRGPAHQPGPRSDCWQIVFTARPDLPIYECAWDDLEGLQRLVAALDSDLDALETHLALTWPQALAEAAPSGWTSLLAPLRGLLDVAGGLTPVGEEHHARLSAAGLAVSRVEAIDPDLCRYVALPGLVHVTAANGLAVSDVDRVVAGAGLVALRGLIGESWAAERYAVVRGHRRAVGSLPPDLWRLMRHPERPHPSSLRRLLRGIFPTGASYVIDTEVLDLGQRARLLSVGH